MTAPQNSPVSTVDPFDAGSAWDCVVVGAGAAGLSAALVLGRARRRTLVIDAGDKSNGAAPVIGGLLGFDGRSPDELYDIGKQQLSAYPMVEYRSGVVVSGAHADGATVLTLQGGEQVFTRRTVLSTGMEYHPPNIPGVQALWGHSLFQCPFCHGWEMRDSRLAALASGDAAVHAALMLRGWSDDVVLLTNGPSGLDADHQQRLKRADVAIDERPIAELIGDGKRLTAVAFADGHQLRRDGMLVEAPLRQRSRLAEDLGAASRAGPLALDAISVDSFYRTENPTVFAAGDTCATQPSVADAIASGSKAAMVVVQSLLADEFDLPYPPGSN